MPYYVHDKIISPNLWDEQSEIGTIDGSTGQDSSSTTNRRSIGYTKIEPNTTYYVNKGNVSSLRYFLYTENKSFILRSDTFTANGTFTTTSNAAYMRIVFSGVTYNNDICINVSNPAINGTYYPYNMGGKPYLIKDNNNSMNIGG